MKKTVACGLLVFCLGGWGPIHGEEALEEGAIAPEEDVMPEKVPEMLRRRPATPSYTEVEEWIDQSTDWVTETLYRQVARVNSMFYGGEAPRSDPRSRFRLKVFGDVDLQSVERSGIRADVSAAVSLPGLRDRFRLVLDSQELDEFPETRPEDRGDRPQLALQRLGRLIDLDVGAKLGLPPRAFTRATYRKGWETGSVEWRFTQRGFYDTREGFGQVTSLSTHCWVNRHLMLGHQIAVRWSESTRGVEWQDSISLFRVLDLVESRREGSHLRYSDMARGIGLRLGIQGFHNGSHEMDQYLLSLIYRRPLLRQNRLFLEVVPEVEWDAGRDWEPTYTLRVGIDVLFWRDL